MQKCNYMTASQVMIWPPSLQMVLIYIPDARAWLAWHVHGRRADRGRPTILTIGLRVFCLFYFIVLCKDIIMRLCYFQSIGLMCCATLLAIVSNWFPHRPLDTDRRVSSVQMNKKGREPSYSDMVQCPPVIVTLNSLLHDNIKIKFYTVCSLPKFFLVFFTCRPLKLWQ